MGDCWRRFIVFFLPQYTPLCEGRASFVTVLPSFIIKALCLPLTRWGLGASSIQDLHGRVWSCLKGWKYIPSIVKNLRPSIISLWLTGDHIAKGELLVGVKEGAGEGEVEGLWYDGTRLSKINTNILGTQQRVENILRFMSSDQCNFPACEYSYLTYESPFHMYSYGARSYSCLYISFCCLSSIRNWGCWEKGLFLRQPEVGQQRTVAL